MRKKKVCIYIIILTLLLPIKTLALENGWVNFNDKIYYYEKGQAVKGFKEIDGKLYFFSRGDDPYMRTGTFQIDYVEYSFNEDGTAKEGFEEKNGKRYYYEKGQAVKGFKEIDGKLYFFSRGDDPYMRTGTFQIDYVEYSFNEDGTAKEGFEDKNGKRYYHEKGQAVKGFKEIDGKLYFFSRGDDPYMRTGTFQIDYVEYSFNEDGTAKEGFEDKNGKRYYYEKGQTVKGFKEIDGKLYFFSRGDDPYMRTGTFQIDYVEYSFNEDGTVKEGFEDKNGKRYYYEKGQTVKGFKEIDGNLYFFSRGDDPYMRTGFFAIDGYYYNFKLSGEMITGLTTMDDGIRYFKENGQMAIGITSIGENKYFFNTNGIRVSGFQQQDNKTYFFSRSADNYMRTGFFAIDGYYYYFADDGVMQSGFHNIENKTRFFSRTDGKMRTGWVNIDGPMYYFNLETGEMLVGNHQIDGINYVFNADGTLRDGFTTDIDGNIRYYFPDGTYAKDWCTIAGIKYFFNSLGVMIGKNVKKVIDVSEHQGVINWDVVKNEGNVDGVILRVAAGSAKIDSQFKKNVSELNRLGIPYGVYIYSYAEDMISTVNDLGTMHEAELEAMRIIKSLKDSGANLSYPIFYDLEIWESRGNAQWNSANYEPLIRRFDNKMIQNGYPDWQIYTNKSWAETALNSNYIKSKITWIAQYNHYCTYDGNYYGWQYSSTEKIPGIAGNVDVSVWFK